MAAIIILSYEKEYSFRVGKSDFKGVINYTGGRITLTLPPFVQCVPVVDVCGWYCARSGHVMRFP